MVIRKKCVVQNGMVLNVGDWDYVIVPVVLEPAVALEDGTIIKEAVIDHQITNPFPEGATLEERDFEFLEDKGWVEVGAATVPTIEERLKQAEETINYILGLE
ncbi:hypothetical protein ACQRXC_03975 [Niallia taxi]|uniref:hypothetical protein n=1 Tax=Niallia taxi TaxID=2499688 RepID=UPI003F5FDBB1